MFRQSPIRPAAPDSQDVIPKHIAIIMDGNGRWAKERLLPRSAGHKQGVEATRKVVSCCARKGVETLTLFAFSSENWQRPRSEVNTLIELFGLALQKQIDQLSKNNIKLKFIGDTNAFPQVLRDKISQGEANTKNNNGLILNIAVNYGGRWDIVQAVKKLLEEIEGGGVAPGEIDVQAINARLSTVGLGEPDLLIRTGGEQRISNFLLWQLAYSELYFTEVLWPDFDEVCLDQALADYAGRQRRFGQTSEQVQRRRADA